MLFYKIEAIVTDENIIPDTRDRGSRSEFASKFKDNSENFYRKQKGRQLWKNEWFGI